MKKQQLVGNSWRTSRVRPESRKKMSILKKGKAEIELIKFQPVLKTSGSVPESTAGLLMGPVPLPAGTAASCPGLGQCQSLHSAGYRLGNVRARRWLSGFLQSCEYGLKASWEAHWHLYGCSVSHKVLVVPQDSGQHLSVIDDCNDHMLTVWDWQKKSKIAEIKVSIFVPASCQSFCGMFPEL